KRALAHASSRSSTGTQPPGASVSPSRSGSWRKCLLRNLLIRIRRSFSIAVAPPRAQVAASYGIARIWYRTPPSRSRDTNAPWPRPEVYWGWLAKRGTSMIATGYAHVELTPEGTPIISGTTMKVVELAAQHAAWAWEAEQLRRQHPY